MVDVIEMKHVLTPTTVAQRYIGQPEKILNGKYWYKSPFRREKTASFVVSDERGFHDFGSSEHYDIISFIQKLYNLNFYEAVNFLARDFGIDFESKDIFTREKIEKIKEEKNKEKTYRNNIEKWYNNTFIGLCISKTYLDEIKNKEHNFDRLKVIYKLDVKCNLYLEMFLNARNYNEKLNLYENEREEVLRIEQSIIL